MELASQLFGFVQLVLLGDSGVGKSCIVLRFVRGQFDPTSKVSNMLLLHTTFFYLILVIDFL